MNNRRRVIFPFYLQDGRRITSPEDLENVLKTDPSYLIPPLKDGRLEKFLSGMGERFVKCLQAETPELALEKLAKELGIEDFYVDKTECGVVLNTDTLQDLLRKGADEIVLPAGKLNIGKLVIDRPVKIVGQGKNISFLEANVLEISSEGVVFENVYCKVEKFLPKQFPEFLDSYFEFESSVSEDFSFARGVEIVKEGNSIKFKPKVVEVEIMNSKLLNNKEVFYRDVKFVFNANENIDITMKNCKCSLFNVSFEFKGSKNIASMLAYNSALSAENCDFKGVPLKLDRDSEVEIINSSFVDSDKALVVINGKAIIRDSKFRSNKVAIYASNISEVEVDNCRFIKNQRGINLAKKAKLEVRNSNYEKHEDPDGVGSGIICSDNSSAIVINCQFIDNQRGVEIGNNAELRIESSKFEKHEDPKGMGSGIVCFHDSIAEVIKCYFVENEGGIWIQNSAKLKVRNAKFEKHRNPNNEGRGIICFGSSSAEIESCQFVGNEYGILIRDSAKIKVKISKFEKHRNSNGTGAGIVCFQDSNAEVISCHFVGNQRGIGLRNNVKLKVEISKFEKHENSNSMGSGILCFGYSSAKVAECHFIENQRGIDLRNNAKLKVKNTKFEKHKNPASKSVGLGVLCLNDSSADVIKCHFTKNQIGIGIQDNAELKVEDSIFVEHIAGIICSNNSSGEVVRCKFAKNEFGIEVQDNANLKIENSFMDILSVYSALVRIINSKVRLIKYDGESKKPAVVNSTVSNWQDVSGCFITTATCLSLGKGDSCYELNTFRKFRDEWLLKQSDGEKLVKEYYNIAPQIVNAINSYPENWKVYKEIWNRYLEKCLRLIENRRYEETKALYLTMVTDLKKQFLN